MQFMISRIFDREAGDVEFALGSRGEKVASRKCADVTTGRGVDQEAGSFQGLTECGRDVEVGVASGSEDVFSDFSFLGAA